ncbi:MULTISPECIES: thioesterase II family protein [Streptomyces]|uniref:Thioesterase II family protein n=2 Tax=Streptomyces TaxID=1883 RepID=A0ABV9J4H3_9ACTN
MPERSALDNPWIRRLVAVPESELRLICFPHAGGSAGYYRHLAMALAPRVETLAVQYPGRQDRRREPPLESIAEMADACFEALGGCLDRPYAFFGHSLGAVVAYEVALRAEQSAPPAGRRPMRLFASAKSAPCVVRQRQVHRFDDDGLMREVRKLGGTGQTLTAPGVRALFLSAMRADYRAVETYTPAEGARLACPITVLVGDSDPLVRVTDTAAWERHTNGGIDSHVFEGGHFYLDSKVQQVAAAVLAAL